MARSQPISLRDFPGDFIWFGNISVWENGRLSALLFFAATKTAAMVAMDVKRRNSIICTDHEVDRLRVGRRAAFAALRWLASNAVAHNLSRFHLRPKFHQLDHCIRRSIRTGVIFSAFWVFLQEDSMGKWSKVGVKVHASVVSSRVIDRWLSLFLCTNKD